MRKVVFNSVIKNHFAQTTLVSQLYNPAPLQQQSEFTFVIPDAAVVSGLMMTTETGNHTAKLETRSRAEAIFLGEKEGNRSAIIVKVSSTKSNELQLTATLKGFGFVNFTLVYEEYLPLRNSSRRQTIRFMSDSIGQTIKGSFAVSLDPNGKEKLKSIKLLDDFGGANESYWLGKRGSSSGYIGKKMLEGQLRVDAKPTRLLNATDEAGKSYHNLTMIYSVDDSNEEQLVLTNDHFAYFFPTKILTTFPKHFIFILDVSGSMAGLKLRQTIDAMITILDSLTSIDLFHIITFSTGVHVWPSRDSPALASSRKQEAVSYVRTLVADGATNINDALLAGLSAADEARNRGLIKDGSDQLILMMTDGYPMIGETRQDVILRNIKSNNRRQVPIHTIAFGFQVDFSLIHGISRDNFGIATM